MRTLTVNIISYKYGHLAAHALESVLAQTRLDGVTVRIFDDGVGDCSHIARIYPEIELVERPANLGQVASMQDALDRTTTDLCLNLGADNWLRPDTLERLLTRPEDIVSYDICITGPKSAAEAFSARAGAMRFPSGYHVWNFKRGDIAKCNYIHGSSMFRTDLAKRHGYRESGSGNFQKEEDWAMWRSMLANGATHHHIPEPMLYYRRHRENFNP